MIERTPKRLMAIGALLIASQQALAWSDEVHIAICEIAMLEASDATRQMVERLQGIENDERFSDFPLACTWADQPPRQRSGEHFINVPRDQAAISVPACPIGDDCLFTAIEQDLRVLSDESAPDAEKWESLKYLGHWIADIHQPLHVSFRDDNGGNKIGMINEDGCFKTLHGAWDHCIAELIMLNYGISDAKEFGRELLSEITSEQRQHWLSDQNTAVWADESFQIARSPDVGYCVQSEQYCQYDPVNIEFVSDSEQKLLPLTESYKAMNSDLVATRIKRAGIRLARLLDAAAENTKSAKDRS